MKELFSIENKEDKKYLNKMFIFSRLIMVLLFLYMVSLDLATVNDIYFNFDSEHYLDIAMEGYTKGPQYAFFPLFPVICKLILSIFKQPALILVFNNVLAYLTGVGIYNLGNMYYNNKMSSEYLAALWYISPIAIYTAVPYTESLFCFLSILILYFYKKESNYILNGILLGLLVSTRSTGSLMFFTLFGLLFIDLIKSIKHEKFKEKFKNILKMYIPATLISCSYPLYLQLKLGNWKYFVDVQYEHWYKEKSNIFTVFLREIQAFRGAEFVDGNAFTKTEFILQSSFALLVLIFSIYAIIWVVKKNQFNIKKELLVYLVLTIWVCYSVNRVFGSPSTSYFRYLAACIPIYLMVDNEKLIRIIMHISVIMVVITTISYYLFMFLY